MTRFPHWSIRCIALGILILGSLGANAQSPLPLSIPDITVNGTIVAVSEQPDGGIVIGGAFTEVNGVERLRIARLRPDGVLDPDWRADANATVRALQIDVAGNVYVGGNFSSIGGVSRASIAKLSAGGIVHPDWSPFANAPVFTLALDGLGHLYVSGGFLGIGGQPREYLAKLETEGAGNVDPVWNPTPDNIVSAFAFDGEGSVFVGGAFTTIGGQARGGVAKLSASGIGAADPDWTASTNASVEALVLDPDGNLIVGGIFTTINDVPRRGLARVTHGSGSVDASWNPSEGNHIATLAIDGDNSAVIVGGGFATMGGLARSDIARLSLVGTGAADADWNPMVNDQVRSIVAAGNRLLVAGVFSTVGGQPRQRLAALPKAIPPDQVFFDGFDGG